MKKRSLTIAMVIALAFAASLAMATSANAFPSQSNRCNSSGCHSGGPAVTVTATQVSNNGVTAVYNISVTGGTSGGPFAYGAFNGTSKVGGPSGPVTLNIGTTYTIFGVSGPSTNTGIGSITLTPVAPAPDTTPPTTTSNAQPSYTGTAVITLTAVDNPGGSGVAATFHSLNGGATITGTTVTVSTPGTYTLDFWSTDNAGNVEPTKSATFVVNPAPADTTPPTTTSNVQDTYTGTANITLTAVDNPGGSGVAHTYYTLNGGPQQTGTSILVSAPGTYTLDFWSVDFAGNIEPTKTANFMVLIDNTPISSTVTIQSSVYRIRLGKRFLLSGLLTPGDIDDTVRVQVLLPGKTRWMNTPARPITSTNPAGAGSWSWLYKGSIRGTYKFLVRFDGEIGQGPAVSRVISVRVQ